MKIDFTLETVFSFDGPNLCFLGDEADFRLLAAYTVALTNPFNSEKLSLKKLPFLEMTGDIKDIVLISKENANKMAWIIENEIVFELDSRYWERLFKYFVLMSWDKSTYYLNSEEDVLNDLDLIQDCNFICSSEFHF